VDSNLNENLCLTTAVHTCSPPTHYNTAIVDTGASDHYFRPGAPLLHIDPSAPCTNIRTATGEHRASSATAQLAIPGFPTVAARTGHIIPGFTNNLISLGKLCDADCTATLDKHTLRVRDKDGQCFLTGHRETGGPRLWRVNIGPNKPTQQHDTHFPMPHLIPDDMDAPRKQQPVPIPNKPTTAHQPVQSHTSHPILEARKTAITRTTPQARAYDLPSVPALIAYLHAAAGYPVKSTWHAAVKRGAFTSWPGLTCGLVARYCPDAPATIQGHMAQPRQHIRSTRPSPAPTRTPTQQPVMSTLELHELPITQLFTDDTGRFHPRARSGNQYVMVALHSGSNAILIRPFASKHDTHRIPAYNDIYARLAAVGAAPDVHIMDNECSAALQRTIASNKCKLQLVPPHVHRRNAAERAIRTFKDHFLAILAGAAPNYPADRWDLLLPHAELTLNLLRPPATGLRPSAWDALFGKFDFNATPLAPAGCAVQMHHKPALRRSWDYRSKDGFYVGPALAHYRCYRILTKDTQSVLISDAVKFRPHNLPSPDITAEDKILHALHGITATLNRGPTPPSL
jgi:hypothetical protein